MSDYFHLLYSGPDQVLPLAVATVLWGALAGLGSLFTPRSRIVDANPLFGWAVVSTAFTLTGAFIRAPFLWLSIGLAVLAAAGIVLAILRRERLFVPGVWRIWVLALPLLLVAGAMDPSQWDEFSHWLPAPKYLLAFDGFPNAAQPYNGPHMLSAYPYGWPILSYLGARLAGGFVDNLGGTLNLFLLLAFASFAVRTAYRIATETELDRFGWGSAAAAALLATILNPTFVQKIVLTAYSDVSTSVVSGFTLVLGLFLLDAVGRRPATASGGRPAMVSLAWQFALLVMLLVNLRQANVVILASVLAGMAVVALRDREIPILRFAGIGGPAILPGLIVYAVWRYYVGRELSALPGGEAAFSPFADWNLAEIPAILGQMLVVAGKKIGFFAPMLVAVAFAVAALHRCRNDFDRTAIVTAVAFLGYNAFLLLTYVGHFSAADALRVVSFWRYNTQIGAFATLFIAVGIVYLVHHSRWRGGYPRWMKGMAILLVLALPLVLPHKLRFDLEPPKPHYFAVARALLGDVPADAQIFVMDPQGTGESALITRYVLNMFGQTWFSAFHNSRAGAIAGYLKEIPRGAYLLVHSSAAGLAEALGRTVDPQRSYLLQREESGWRELRSWPHPSRH